MTFKFLPPAALFIPIALALTGCESEAEAPKGDDPSRGAEGEVLGGTISDEMIHYESIQSRAPTLEEEPDGGSAANDEGESDEEESAQD